MADSLALLNDIKFKLSPIHYACLSTWNLKLRELELSTLRRRGGRG